MTSTAKFTPKTPRREKSTLSSSTESLKTKDPVNVYSRLRNLNDEKDPSCIKLVSPTVLSVSCPTDSKLVRKDSHYAFKHIFTSYASQKEVFDHVAYPLIEDLLKGKNGLLFTYGVTGSGKTYTLMGDPYNPGIIPRSIDTIFNSINEFQASKYVIKPDKMNGFEVQSEQDAGEEYVTEMRHRSLQRRKGGEYKTTFSNDGTKVLGLNEVNLYAVFITFTEIYNNSVYDLLDESGGKILQSKILREDSQKNMYVNGVTEIEVKSAAEAFELFNIGQKRKRMAHTLLNAESSRGHSIFNIRVVQLEEDSRNGQGEKVIHDHKRLKIGQLSLVDLAGSERTNRTHNTGKRLKEASCINNSLMSLRNCIEILRDNQMNNANRLVPYRDSRLTLLFKNYFEGEGKVQMIVCINPSVQDYEENLNVMKFAELTQDIKLIRPESRYTPYRKQTKPKTPGQNPIRKIKSLAPLVFGPKVPHLILNLDDLDDCLSQVKKSIKILQTRKQKTPIFKRDLKDKENHFRKRLIDINQEYVLKQTEIASLQQQYKKEKKKNQNLDVKVLEYEKILDNLDSRNDDLNKQIRALKERLDEKDMKLNQNQLDREKQKQKLAVHKERLNQELDDKLRRQRQHLNAAMEAKEQKIKKMREVLESDYDIDDVVTTTQLLPPQTDMDTQTQDYEPQQTPKSISKHTLVHRRNVVATNRRRSRSAGEVWLEHNAVKPVPLGTVLQPSMKRRKSVTKLTKASDVTNTKQSKYCLIAQEADTDGEVETKVYKADIVPTCGGGAQVIFNDVERLRQESPTATPY